MKKKVLIFDTSVLCVWLKVPGKETCGSKENRLTFDMVNAKIEEEKSQGTTFVLPIGHNGARHFCVASPLWTCVRC